MFTITNTSELKYNRTSIVALTAVVGNQERVFVGVANCHPDDWFDPEVGREIASARAYRQVIKALMRQTAGQERFEENRLASLARKQQATYDGSDRVVSAEDMLRVETTDDQAPKITDADSERRALTELAQNTDRGWHGRRPADILGKLASSS